MRSLSHRVLGGLSRRRRLLAVLGLAVLLVAVVAPKALAGDVYSNIGPAPQLPAGSLQGAYPLSNYSLDQYFPGISVGIFSGIDVSGVPPLIAYFIAQVIWTLTAFLANALITLFAFAFSLNLLTGSGGSGGALQPVAQAIHNLYTHTFGTPWLVAAILAAGLWAMWKALVQRRYTETAGALALSLVFCVIAIGIVTEPERTIAPASKLSNELSDSILSLSSKGELGNEAQAKTDAGNQLFSLLVLDPWTVLEFGGIEQCARVEGEKVHSVAVQPLSSDPAEDSKLASELESGTEVKAQGKTCVNAANKYAPHFLAYASGSEARGEEHEALEKGTDEDLPESDPGKHGGSYPLSPVDEPAAEAMGKGGQYQRLLLAIVILFGELGAFLLLGALSLGIILAQILLLTLLAFAPVALLVAIFPGRGHEFFRRWLAKLAGYLARKVVYSLILAVLLAVCKALADATSNLGWLLAFLLQAAFLWTVFLQRHRLTEDLLAVGVGHGASRDPATRLERLYLASGLARAARSYHQRRAVRPTPAPLPQKGTSPTPKSPPSEPPEESA